MKYGARKCNGCEYLKHEDMERGAGALRCMRAGRGLGRTVNYSRVDRFVETYTPVWCDKEDEHVDKI